MDTTTLLIIILLILVLFGGGYYGRGRWWWSPDCSERAVPKALASRKMTDARHQVRLHHV